MGTSRCAHSRMASVWVRACGKLMLPRPTDALATPCVLATKTEWRVHARASVHSILDESKLKPNDPRGPFRLKDGREQDEITVAQAEEIAAKIGIKKLPTFPWPPAGS